MLRRVARASASARGAASSLRHDDGREPGGGSRRSARRRAARGSPTRRWWSTATAGCCGPTPRRRAAGGCRRRATTSIRASSTMLFAYEDKRFLSHRGVDPLALGRALPRNSSSTAASSRAPRRSPCRSRGCWSRARERSFIAKLRQMVRAIQLERTLSKDEILALYLSLAPYGGNLEGIRAASLAYFGKEPRRLTLAESALLVALPQSPELRRPDRSVAAARSGARPRARPARGGGRRAGRRGRARQARDRCRRAAGRCRCWRRMRPTRWSPRRPAAPSTG